MDGNVAMKQRDALSDETVQEMLLAQLREDLERQDKPFEAAKLATWARDLLNQQKALMISVLDEELAK